MSHWENRPEAAWKEFHFNQPYEKGLRRLKGFDCRVQRCLVQGMLEALKETGVAKGFQVRFDWTIPAGAETCHFTLWRGSADEKKARMVFDDNH